MLLSDDTLARDALEGGSEAFRLLVERHQGRLYAIASGMLQSDDQAADAVQETFLKAYRALGQYRGGAFGAWLRRILVNECLSVLRSRQPYLSLDELTADLPSGERTPEEECIARADVQAVRAALRRLPAHYRSALVLRLLEGLSYREIARLLAVPVSTVETWIHRGRLRLQTLLGEQLEVGGRRPGQAPHRAQP